MARRIDGDSIDGTGRRADRDPCDELRRCEAADRRVTGLYGCERQPLHVGIGSYINNHMDRTGLGVRHHDGDCGAGGPEGCDNLERHGERRGHAHVEPFRNGSGHQHGCCSSAWAGRHDQRSTCWHLHHGRLLYRDVPGRGPGRLMTMWKWLALFALAPVLANARVTILNGVNIGGGVSVSNSSAPPAPPPSSPFALVAHTTSVASQNTVTTPAIDTSTANICIVKPSWAVSSTSITCAANISDSKSNTWLTASAPVGSTTGSGICYAAPCTTGAGHTFTFTKTAASLFGSIQVAAFKGAGTISLAANDVSSANSGGASVTTLQAGGGWAARV